MANHIFNAERTQLHRLATVDADGEQNKHLPAAERRRRNSVNLNEYLLGSRRLKAFPVAMSLIASYISGVTILGTPTEIYNFGTQYWLIVVPIGLMGWIVSTVYLPVYTTLRVTSSYEYLELRFSSTVRTMASLLFVLDEVRPDIETFHCGRPTSPPHCSRSQWGGDVGLPRWNVSMSCLNQILFLPFIIYVPALAFNQVTGINIHLISGIVCVVCIFYTILGGIKAVVCTDAWQVGVMFAAVLVIIVMGTVTLGGPWAVVTEAQRGGRLEFFK